MAKLKGTDMLAWVIIFLIIAVVAGIFGFTDVAVGAQSISKALFFMNLVFFLGILLFGKWLGLNT
ncbi:MAG: DUF1328 domain-containing protein [Candidatus Competibacteraceae bacterium]